MQNRYTGDIGDFGKYGLLRALCHPQDYCEPSLRLAVIWYLVPNEAHNDDGKYVQYLEPREDNLKRFRDCDPLLFDSLAQIVRQDKRSVTSIRAAGILPPDTVFYDAPLSYAGIPWSGARARELRVEHRRRWVEEALKASAQSDLIFVDPDNGLECHTKPYAKRGPKYAYFDELLPYVHRGRSLVIYHHLNRSCRAQEQVTARLRQMGEVFKLRDEPIAVLYKRGTLRSFFIVAAPAHRDILLRRIVEFLRSEWRRHFERMA